MDLLTSTAIQKTKKRYDWKVPSMKGNLLLNFRWYIQTKRDPFEGNQLPSFLDQYIRTISLTVAFILWKRRLITLLLRIRTKGYRALYLDERGKFWEVWCRYHKTGWCRPILSSLMIFLLISGDGLEEWLHFIGRGALFGIGSECSPQGKSFLKRRVDELVSKTWTPLIH